jgi:hypothetical protein
MHDVELIRGFLDGKLFHVTFRMSMGPDLRLLTGRII